MQVSSSTAASVRPPATSPAGPPLPGAASGVPTDAATKPGTIHTETLPNGVRIVVAERPGATATKFQVGIGAGSLQDPEGKLGLAHMLEHLAFEGSPTRSAPQQEELRKRFGNNWNAWTNQSEVVFWGIIPSKDAKQGAALVTDMFRNPATTGTRVPQERAAVENEMLSDGGTLETQGADIVQRLLYGDGPATNNVIGTRKSVDAISSKDLQAFHRNYFTGRNTVVLVDGDPGHLALDTIRKELGALPAGARVDNQSIKAEVVPGPALQVVNQSTSSTVDLNVLVPIPTAAFEGVDSPGAVSLLVSSLNSRLNDRLRRNDHLTYGASARLEPGEGTTADQMALHVSTTVDAGFAKQALDDILHTLKDSRDGFGPKTFAKDKAEARALQHTREPGAAATTSELADEAFTNALSTPGITVPTAEEFAELPLAARDRALSRVTEAQLKQAASAIVKLDDVKVLAIGALKDGGAQLLDSMDAAGIARAGVDVNPVDFGIYRDMGIAVPRNATPPLRPAQG